MEILTFMHGVLEHISKTIENGWNQNIIETNTKAHIARVGSMMTLFFSDKNEINLIKEQIINQEKEKKLKMFSNMHFSNIERSIQIKFL